MAYKVIHDFVDTSDKRYAYKVGDEYPRTGFNVSEDRLKELSLKTKFRPALIEGNIDKTKKAPAKPQQEAVPQEADSPQKAPADETKPKKRSTPKKAE